MKILHFPLMALTTLIVAVASPMAIANHQQNSNNYQQDYSGWSWSANVDHITIDKEVANRPDILLSQSATAIGLGAEYFTSESEMTYSIGLNYIAYNDNNEFEQYVYDHWNGSRYEKSDANAIMVYAEAGPKYRFGVDGSNFFTVRGGFSQIFASSRSIGYCDDCYSEDLDIKGGLYGSLGVGHSFNSFDLGLQFQQYFTGDLDNSLRLKISTTF